MGQTAEGATPKALGGNASSPSSPAGRILALATIGFAINFWAWALISPLGAAYLEQLELSTVQQALLVAVPVIVGSIGRIPVGALTDRFGARLMFPAVTLLTVIPVLFVGFVADTYPLLLLGGFFLGLGGTTFAIGIPLVNAWFAPQRRGLALGIFGVGMGGTAISAFTTVRLFSSSLGHNTPFVIVAVILVIYALVAAVWLRDAPGRTVLQGSFVQRTWDTIKLPATAQLSFIYAVGFGGFVAFSVYLPTQLRNEYGLTENDAALRTAGFVVLAVAARPIGGWLSDRVRPIPVLTVCFAAAAAFAFLASARLNLLPSGSVAFLGLAATLGASSGACFALVAKVAPAEKVGAVTGVVGAAGGLGGFVPPLVMGSVFDRYEHYTVGLLALAVVALGAAAFTWWPVQRSLRTS